MNKKLLLPLISLLGLSILSGCNKTKPEEEFVSPEISLSEAKINISEGSTFQLTATTSETSMIVYWFTRDNDIATVSNDGLVTALKAGNTICYAQVGKNTAMCSVNVTPYEPDEALYVTSTQTEIELDVGDEYLLPLTVTYGKQEVTDYTVRAEVKDETICSYSSNSITALKAGNTTVLVTVNYLDNMDQLLFTITVA